MILSDREIQAALKLRLILIEPEPDRSLFSSTSLDLSLEGTLLRWNDSHPLPTGQPNKLRPTGGGFDLKAVMDDPRSTTRHPVGLDDGREFPTRGYQGRFSDQKSF